MISRQNPSQPGRWIGLGLLLFISILLPPPPACRLSPLCVVLRFSVKRAGCGLRWLPACQNDGDGVPFVFVGIALVLRQVGHF